MIIPVRCFTCGTEISSKWRPYRNRVDEEYNKLLQADPEAEKNIINDFDDTNEPTIEANILDELKIIRYCCRRMLLTHVDLYHKIKNH